MAATKKIATSVAKASPKASPKTSSIAKARATRHGVRVEGKEYPSSFKAFEALKLPTGRHNRFRLILKREGKATFEHGKKKHAFALVERRS